MADERAWCVVFHKWCFRCCYNLRMSEIFYPHRGVNASKEQLNGVAYVMESLRSAQLAVEFLISKTRSGEVQNSENRSEAKKKRGGESKNTCVLLVLSLSPPLWFLKHPRAPVTRKKTSKENMMIRTVQHCRSNAPKLSVTFSCDRGAGIWENANDFDKHLRDISAKKIPASWNKRQGIANGALARVVFKIWRQRPGLSVLYTKTFKRVTPGIGCQRLSWRTFLDQRKWKNAPAQTLSAR